jgi:hypothetical protein
MLFNRTHVCDANQFCVKLNSISLNGGDLRPPVGNTLALKQMYNIIDFRK